MEKEGNEGGVEFEALKKNSGDTLRAKEESAASSVPSKWGYGVFKGVVFFSLFFLSPFNSTSVWPPSQN